MEARRAAFWVSYLAPMKTVIVHRLRNQGKVAPSAIDGIATAIIAKTARGECDSILCTSLVWLIRADESMLKGGYNGLFSMSHDEIVRFLNGNAPQAIRIIHQRLHLLRSHFNSLLDRLSHDFDDIAYQFGLAGDDSISALSLTLGDIHEAGRQTSLVQFQSGKGIIYKPVSLELDELIYGMLKRLAFESGTFVIVPPIYLKRDGYGYMEFLPTENDVTMPTEAQRIYDELSFLLAAACVLGIGDMHSENLLIKIPHAYLLDLETALSATEDLKDPVVTAHTDINPVSRTGFIININDIPPVVGLRTGLQGGEFPILSRTIPVLENDGTDGISIRYKVKSYPPGRSANRIWMNGALVSMFDYEQAFIEGFGRYYEFLLTRKDAIVGWLREAMTIREIRSRRIFCATSVYRQFLSLLEHVQSHFPSGPAQHLNEIHDRLLETRKMNHAHMKEFVVSNELLDLTSGIIPYFYRKSSTRHLYHSSGAFLPDAYELTMIEELKAHLSRLPPVDDLIGYLVRSYDSVRNTRTHDDLDTVLAEHDSKNTAHLAA